MSRQFSRLLMVLLTLALSFTLIPAPASQAAPAPQSDRAPLVFLIDGDIWTYTLSTNSWAQLSTWGHNQRPVIAPYNNLIAYNSTASLFINYLQNGGGWGDGAALPSNIWVMEIESGDAERIANQPEGASIEGGTYIARSDPAFSPDGRRIAWTEYALPAGIYQLAIYDFSTQDTTRMPISAPNANPNYLPPTVQFGPELIALHWTVALGSPPEAPFSFYSPEGVLVEQVTLPPLADGVPRQVITSVWFRDANPPTLGVLYSDGLWRGVVPLSTPDTTAVQTPAFYATSTGSIGRVIYVPGSNASTGAYWQYQSPVASPEFINSTELHPIYTTLSPDAMQVAYYIPTDNTVYIKDGPNYRTLTPPTGRIQYVTWSHRAWIMDGNNSTITGLSPCGPLPLRLSPGVSGQVAFTDGRPLNVRDSAAGEIINSLPEGSTFTVIAGYECRNGFIWWQINTPEGITGWIAEGDVGGYYVEPLP